MTKKTIIIIFFSLAVIYIGGLTLAVMDFSKPVAPGDKLSVVASFYPLAFFAEQIGGDKANVISLTPARTEPHDYEPTARDLGRIKNSRMLILNGGGLEAWADQIRQNLNLTGTVIVIAGEGLANLPAAEKDQRAIDPHVWLSPVLAEKMADKIAQGFLRIDPVNKVYYLSRAQTLKNQLADLNKEFRQELSACSEKNIITSHAAFSYLVAAYGLNQVPITGLSPEAEFSPRQLAEMVKFAKANKVKFIFFENLISPKLAETIADEIGAETLTLNPLEGLSDQDTGQGKNYFTEMRNNLTNLKRALLCR